MGIIDRSLPVTQKYAESIALSLHDGLGRYPSIDRVSKKPFSLSIIIQKCDTHSIDKAWFTRSK